jgi:hypothetical protein
MKRAFLVALCLLLSPATASAECAWVLWHGIINPVNGELEWGPNAAYPAGKGQRECEEGAQAMMQQDKSDRKRNTTLLRSAFVCLPDTVDPRGAKSK